MIERLQYITQDHLSKSHEELCREACEAGVKWVQLRMKNVSQETYKSSAKACRSITTDYGAKLIINDNLDLAIEVGADGVHLGLKDLNTAEARLRVAKNFIIGGTANTLEHILEHVRNGVDYVGVGPLRYTATKENLSPVIGEEGYRELMNELNALNVRIPLIAIGGIVLNDIEYLIKTGVHGVAVSGLLSHSGNKKEIVSELNSLLNYAGT